MLDFDKTTLRLQSETLFEEILSDDNILLAISQSLHNKSNDSKCHYTTFHLFLNDILSLIKENIYTPDIFYKEFYIFDRKYRHIVAPQNFNSLIQRCIYNVISNEFFNIFSRNVYSCIPNRSAQLANIELSQKVKNVNKNYYYLKTDFHNFFGSINSFKLYDKLHESIGDTRVLNLLSQFIFKGKRSCGIPFGNLLSQIFGNFYVNDLDKILEKQCQIYSRFADDIILIDELSVLKRLENTIKDYCKEHNLKFSYIVYNKIKGGFKFCGWNHRLEFSTLDSRHNQTKNDKETYNRINLHNFSKNKITKTYSTIL